MELSVLFELPAAQITDQLIVRQVMPESVRAEKESISLPIFSLIE